MIDINILDFIAWLVICIILGWAGGEGNFVMAFFVILFTIVWTILFVFIDYDVINIIKSISISW